MITPIPLNQNPQEKQEAGNYEGIEENNNRIEELIQNLERRDERIEKRHQDNVSKYFRTLQAHRKDQIDKLQRQTVEEIQLRKNNVINLDPKKQKGEGRDQYIKDPLKAKDGLKTGLPLEEKQRIRKDENKYEMFDENKEPLTKSAHQLAMELMEQ